MANKKTAGIRKVSDRRYEIDHVITVDGRRVHVRASGFRSAQEAKEAMPAIVEAKRRAVRPTLDGRTFDGLAEAFLDYKRTRVKTQTMNEVRYVMGKHILPRFSGLPAGEALSLDSVTAWRNALVGSASVSAKRKNRAMSLFREVVDFAWKRRYITSEAHQDVMAVAENVRTPSAAKTERATWDAGQMARFLESIPKDSADYPMFSLFCYLGCRLGEFLGLQWKCLNERQGTVSICQQVIVADGGPVLTTELKTNESYRVDRLDGKTLALLLDYRSTLNSSEDDEFMFPSPYGSRSPMSRTEFRRRFDRYVKLSGLPKIVPHGVRHSKATMIAGVCRNAEEIAVGAKFLGHSSTMFMETYVSKSGVDQGDIISRLNGGAEA